MGKGVCPALSGCWGASAGPFPEAGAVNLAKMKSTGPWFSCCRISTRLVAQHSFSAFFGVCVGAFWENFFFFSFSFFNNAEI